MVEVVAALIWENDKFMICQRPAHKARALLWEFVGGKVEPGETKEQALIRECQEELAVKLLVGDVFMDVIHEYLDITVHLTLFNATIAEGVPQKLEHNDIKWIKVSEIDDYDFCPADTEILEKLKLGKKIANFDPTNIEFTFNFTTDTCPKLKTGFCNLDAINLIKNIKIDDKQLRTLSRCQRIYFGLRDETIRVLPPQIMKCKCGHYICSDGQHRICVAQRMNLTLDVIALGDIDGNCEKCTPVCQNIQMVEADLFSNGIKLNIVKK